jgi:hypothetical protein
LTAQDVIDGATSVPTAFEFGGFGGYLLRPLTRAEVLAVFAWRDKEGDRPGVGMEMQAKIIALALCDEKGRAVIGESRVAELPNAAIDALADEIARRNWGPPEGKNPPATTTG